MPLHDAPGRSAVRDDESPYDRTRYRPPKLPRQDSAESGLHVEPLQQVLKIADAALDLDHKQGPSARVPCDEVTAASIPVVVEADLRLHHPPSRREPYSCRLLKIGVLPINQPIQVGALPPNLDDERGVQHFDQA